jgi:uncharacterized protein (DUF1697 family)
VTTYVALLRGINVGGNRRIKMDVLRELVTGAGYADVRTYIQSGNVVCTGDEEPVAEVARRIGRHISAGAGFGVPVVVLTADHLVAVADAQPYPTTDGKLVHLAFLEEQPDADAISAIDLASFAPSTLSLGDRVVYLHLPHGLGRSELAAALTDRVLGSRSTWRNWNTVAALLDLVH